MENKFLKIGAFILAILFVGLVAAVISLTTGEQGDTTKQSAVEKKTAPDDTADAPDRRLPESPPPKDRQSAEAETASPPRPWRAIG